MQVPASWLVAEGDRPHPFYMLVALASARGHSRLTQTLPPGTTLELVVDDRWRAWVNPFPQPATFNTDDGGMSGEVPPFTWWINFNGWLWGLVDPFHGVRGEGEAANPETLCKAIVAAWPEGADLDDGSGLVEVDF